MSFGGIARYDAVSGVAHRTVTGSTVNDASTSLVGDSNCSRVNVASWMLGFDDRTLRHTVDQSPSLAVHVAAAGYIEIYSL